MDCSVAPESLAAMEHRFARCNGIQIHFVEQGTGPLVLLLHGFPETWYSWRHQIPVLAEAGYHVVAPDLRGYGRTEVPVGVENYTALHVVGDLIGLLDDLGVEKAFVVGHDWGAIIAWYLCLFRPDRVLALVSLSVHFIPRTPAGSLLQQMRRMVGEHHYICQFQVPGKVEQEIALQTNLGFLKKIFSTTSSSSHNSLDDHSSLPSYITEEDLRCYAHDFERSGFTGPLNYYRALDLSWELMAPWTNGRVVVPTLFMVGEKDLVYSFPGAKDYIHKGGMLEDVPNLVDVIILDGVDHFLHEESPNVATTHILNFLNARLEKETHPLHMKGKL